MTVRAVWKGYVRFGQLSCPVSLFTAISTAERISLKLVTASQAHTIKRIYVDSSTGEEVDRDQQVKGYEVAKDRYVTLEQGEIDQVAAENDKTLHIKGFLPKDEADELFLGKQYFMAPQDAAAGDAFLVLRDALIGNSAVAIARATLFRRARTVALVVTGNGIMAQLLRYNYEVRLAKREFSEIGSPKITEEMLSLAEHIIAQKQGAFDPAGFEDRYEDALAALVKAKMAGKKITPVNTAKPSKAVNLLDALRASAEGRSRPKLAAKTASSATKRSPSVKSRSAGRKGARKSPTPKSTSTRKAS